jgi:hypothetical protein
MKYGNKKLFLLIPLLLIAFISIFSLAVFAQTQTNYDVTVSPVFFDFSSNPGGQISDKIRLRNDSNSPITINIKVEKLRGDLNGNFSLNSNNNDGSLSWIKFSANRIVAKALEWTDVPFTINIPKDGAYGYYFAISFEEVKNGQIARNGAQLTGAAAVPILLDVIKEGARSEAKILEFKTANYVNEYLPVDFTVKVENTGNIHVKPHGNIFISNGNSKSLASLDINPNLGSVIPQSARIFTASWLDGFAVMEPIIIDGQPKLDNKGNPQEHLVINWDRLTSFRIGKYDANLLMVFDNGTKDIPLEANLSFWVFPYKLIAGLIVGLIIIILLVRLALKNYVNRELKRKEKQEKVL